MSKTWLVTGESGEYSSWQFWIAAVFTDKTRADEWCALAQEWERENRDAVREADYHSRPVNPYDAHGSSYSDVDYAVEENVLDPALPVVAAAPVNPDSPAPRPPRES